jgi:hypothetical protein
LSFVKNCHVFNWREVCIAQASVSKMMNVLNELLRAPSCVSFREAVADLLGTIDPVSGQSLLQDRNQRSIA